MNRPFGHRNAVVKPENAIQRAEELLAVNQPNEALNVLQEFLNMRRTRNAPPTSLEALVMKYLGLAVLLRRYGLAREGLYLYKNISQSTSVVSVEKVIRHFLECSEARLNEVIDQEPEVATIDDLESLETFNSLFLSMLNSLDNDCAVRESKTANKDASLQKNIKVVSSSVVTTTGDNNNPIKINKGGNARDKDGFTSRLHFMWEAYRIVLDILRNNGKFDLLYQTVAKQAFGFCLRHARKNEFRRLCETLRSHLNTMRRTGNMQNSVNIGDPDILERFLETRFSQFQTATDLEMWQECFRSAEDIYELLVFAAERICALNNIDFSHLSDILPTQHLSNKTHRSKMVQILLKYYEKLTNVFAVTEDSVFLAAAWRKYYAWTCESKNSNIVTPSYDEESIANNVILASLAAPVYQDSKILGCVSNNTALTPGYSVRFNRKDRLTKMIGCAVIPSRKNLLSHPVTKDALEKASPSVRELYDILEVGFHPLTVAKRMRKISALLTKELPEYKNYAAAISNVAVIKILSKISTCYSVIGFESIQDFTNVSNQTGRISLFQLEKLVLEGNKKNEFNIRINHTEQRFEFNSSAIEIDFTKILQIPILSASRAAEREEVFKYSRLHADDEHWQNIGRLDAIEEIKVKNEECITMIVRQPQEDNTQKAREAAEALKERVEADLLASKAERHKQEQVAASKADARKEADMLRTKYSFLIRDEDLEHLDAEAVDKLYKSHVMQERQNIESKMKEHGSKADYIERALREAEIPLVLEQRKIQVINDKKEAEARRQKDVEASKVQHALDLKLMERVQRMQKHADLYLEQYAERFREEIDNSAMQMAKRLLEAKEDRRMEVISKIRERTRAIETAERLRREKEMEEEVRHANEQKQARLREEEAEAERRRMRAYIEPVMQSFDEGSDQPRPSDTENQWRRGPSTGFGERAFVGAQDSGPERREIDELQNWRANPPMNASKDPRRNHDLSQRGVIELDKENWRPNLAKATNQTQGGGSSSSRLNQAENLVADAVTWRAVPKAPQEQTKQDLRGESLTSSNQESQRRTIRTGSSAPYMAPVSSSRDIEMSRWNRTIQAPPPLEQPTWRVNNRGINSTQNQQADRNVKEPFRNPRGGDFSSETRNWRPNETTQAQSQRYSSSTAIDNASCWRKGEINTSGTAKVESPPNIGQVGQKYVPNNGRDLGSLRKTNLK